MEKIDAPPGPVNFPINIDALRSSLFNEKNISVSMLRLDQIHDVVSGNKLFKLHYFLEEAQKSNEKLVITFGGAYSNHLAATAFACKALGLKSIGFVRGEKADKLSHTLHFCIENGMQLEFMSREDYRRINDEEMRHYFYKKFGGHTLIPEGGYSTDGAMGAELICKYFIEKNFSHVCCAVGTATTFAGLINGSNDRCTTMGFSVLKDLLDIRERLSKLNVSVTKKYAFIEDYHFNGYAKKTKHLIDFINDFYASNKIPLDFVYTGKLMYGVYDLIQKNYFPTGSKILCIHTGGLQGNNSLPAGTLNF
jgi:1-aminocyclopropane-1-carboxylate deaminase